VAQAAGVAGAGEFDALKDKVLAYKARKRAAMAGGGGGKAEDSSVDQSMASADSTDEGADRGEADSGKGKSEFDTTIDSCLSVMIGPNKTPDYLEDLWVRAATIAIHHVPRRKTEVVYIFVNFMFSAYIIAYMYNLISLGVRGRHLDPPRAAAQDANVGPLSAMCVSCDLWVSDNSVDTGNGSNRPPHQARARPRSR
jgi:hypothetical protein